MSEYAAKVQRFTNRWIHIWARGYYAAIIGNLTEDAIKKYIKG
jgi:REP element-mobilizing transposase RayT